MTASATTRRKRHNQAILRPNPEVRLSPARKDPLLRKFKEVAGREEITEALELSDDARARSLASMMWDPAYRHHTFAKLAEKVGLRYRDIIGMFREAKLLEVVLRVSRHLPELIDDIAINAKSRVRTCSACGGGGKVDGQRCLECEGVGTIRIPGDIKAARLLFQVGGLIGRRAAPVGWPRPPTGVEAFEQTLMVASHVVEKDPGKS